MAEERRQRKLQLAEERRQRRVDTAIQSKETEPGVVAVLERGLKDFISKSSNIDENARESMLLYQDISHVKTINSTPETILIAKKVERLINNFLDALDIDQNAVTPAVFERYKQETTDAVKELIASVKNINVIREGAKAAAALKGTEKSLFASKVPEDVANKITGYLTGKKGSLDDQLSKLKGEAGRGGGKTKKNRTKRRKTHGRRV